MANRLYNSTNGGRYSIRYFKKGQGILNNEGLLNFIAKQLKICFPSSKEEFLERDLRTKRYDLFIAGGGQNMFGLAAAKPDEDGKKIYLTHVCRWDQVAKKFVQAMFNEILIQYGADKIFHLRVRKENPVAIAGYETVGFRITDESNPNFYTMEYSLRTEVENMTLTTINDMLQKYNTTAIRNVLLKITAERWRFHRAKWVDPTPGSDTHMQLIYGNLAITMALVLNHYLNGGYVLPAIEMDTFGGGLVTPEQLNEILRSQLGQNYFVYERNKKPTHKLGADVKATTADVFRTKYIGNTFDDLKNYASEVFNSMYTALSNKPGIQNISTAPVRRILPFIATHFSERYVEGDDLERWLAFNDHNLGIYQYLAMYGIKYEEEYGRWHIYPHSGNSTIVALLRLSLYERLTRSTRRQGLLLAVQGRQIDNREEVCHYGLLSKNLRNKGTPEDLELIGIRNNMPTTYLSGYRNIYDVLSTNAIYRAIKRAQRNYGEQSEEVEFINNLSSEIRKDFTASAVRSTFT